MKLTINVPVWGERYRKNFIERGLPSINAALKYSHETWISFIIHTDNREELEPHFRAANVQWLPVPDGINAARKLGNADREGLRLCPDGNALIFINADMVISVDAFAYLEAYFHLGKKFISVPSIRTLDKTPPIGVTAKELLWWSWHNRHLFTDDCIWKHGHCKLPPYIFFRKDDCNVIMHAFDLHPFAIYKTNDLQYTGPSASEIIGLFDWNEILVCGAQQIAIAEPCIPELDYARFKNKAYSKRHIVNWARYCFSLEQQYSQFSIPIRIIGTKGDYNAESTVRNIQRTLLYSWNLRSRLPSRFDLALMLPYRVRQWVPKPIRQFIINWEWER